MIHAFFDESGTHRGSPLMVLAGYVFQAKQYERFEVEWTETLKEFQIDYFHAKECAHFRGPFEGMPENTRRTLLERLCGIVRRRMALGQVFSLAESDWFVEMPDRWSVTSYTQLTVYALWGVAQWAQQYSPRSPLALTFEAGHARQSEAKRAFDFMMGHAELRDFVFYESHSFTTRDKALGLQAADLLAYEAYKDRMNIAQGSLRPRRGVFANLLGVKHSFLHLDREALRGMVGNSKKLNGLSPAEQVDLMRRIQESPGEA